MLFMKIFLLLLTIIKNISAVFIKCCDDEYHLSDNLECTKILENITDITFNIANKTGLIFKTCIYGNY